MLASKAKSQANGEQVEWPIVSTMTFVFYCAFIAEFFLHLSQRIPGIGVLRPTLLLILIVTGLIYLQRDFILKRNKSQLSIALKTLIIYMIISIPFVTYPGSAIKAGASDFIKVVVFFYFTATCVDTVKRLNIFILVYAGCQIFRVLEPLYLNITEGYWGDSTYLGDGESADRLSGAPYDVINPNELGFVIATCVPFLHFMLFPKGWLMKGLYAGLMVCLLYALILTMSRGALLALLVVGFMVFKASKYKSLLIVAAIGIAIAGWGVMNDVQKDRYLSLVSSDTKGARTVDGRFAGMGREFELGFTRPIFGHGIGTTVEAKANYYGQPQASHNMYAELLIEIGLIGMWVFLKFLKTIHSEIKKLEVNFTKCFREQHPEIYRVRNVLVALFWMYVVYSSNYWGLTQNYWYLLAGFTVAYASIVKHTFTADLQLKA